MACLFNTLKGLCLPLFWEFSFPLGSFPSLPHTAWVGLSVELPGTLWSKDGHVINLDQSDSSESDWHVLGNDRGDVFQLWSLYLFLSPRPLELFKFLFFFFLMSCFFIFSLSLYCCLKSFHNYFPPEIADYHVLLACQEPERIQHWSFCTTINGLVVYPPPASCVPWEWEVWIQQQCIVDAVTRKFFA